MTGTILFLMILILAAAYGVFALARLALRSAFPLKPRLAAYASFALGMLFACGMTLGASGILSGVRENAFAQGYADAQRDADSASAEQRAELYTDAYAKGYADAVDGYLADRFSAETATDASDALEAEPAPLILLPDPEDEPAADEETPPERGMPDPEGEANGEEAVREPTGTIVYYTPSGSVIHFDPNCTYLKNASSVISCDLADAPDRRHCSRCG